MPVELRKRKAAAEPAPAPAPKKAVSRSSSKASTAKAKTPTAKAAPAKAAAPSGAPEVGSTIELDGFGGAVETNDGEATTLKKLVDDSKGGVVLLAYPKASTPGCTTQVCLARDSFAELTSTGFSIFGISRDSPKANTTFKTKQNLPYSLICDKEGTLITAIGLKKAPSGTTRGVFVVDRTGKVLAARAASPKDSVDVVKELVGGSKLDNDADDVKPSSAEQKVEEEGKDPKDADGAGKE